MEPQDYGKLVFQSEFGPEHMITGRQDVFTRIEEEIEEILSDSSPEMAEDIGGGLCRFPLPVCQNDKAAALLLAELFVLTAKECHGTKDKIREKLKSLTEFKIPGMEEWAKVWGRQGYPAISHSAAYRDTYHPHYRLLRKDYAGSFQALLAVKKLLEKKGHIIVGIDGRCGSGKTHLADLAGRLFSCNIIHMDDFYLPPAKRKEGWKEIPGGNIDFGRLMAEVTGPLCMGKEIVYRPYDCEKGAFTEMTRMQPKALTIIEGSYSHHPSAEIQYDLKIFLTCEKDEQSRRLKEREGDYYPVFERQWIPMEENYFRYYEVEKRSDIKIESSDFM